MPAYVGDWQGLDLATAQSGERIGQAADVAQQVIAWGTAVSVIGIVAALAPFYGPWWGIALLLPAATAASRPSRSAFLGVGLILAVVALTGLPAGGRQPLEFSVLLAAAGLLALLRYRAAAHQLRGSFWVTKAAGLLGAIGATLWGAVWYGFLPILPWLEAALATSQSAFALAAGAAIAAHDLRSRAWSLAALAVAMAALGPLVWFLFLAP